MENHEIRSLNTDSIEIRVDETDNGMTMTGYAARFNSWSEDLGGFKERIMPGAFKKALMTSDVRLLYNHDSNNLPLGRTPKTLRLVEDTKGLKIEADLPDTQFAKDLKTAIDRGDLREMSFGFIVAENGDEWKEKDGMVKRTITEVEELFDVSVVVFPAYKSTRVSVRSLEKCKEVKDAATRATEATLHDDEAKNLDIDLLNKTRKNGGTLKC